MKLNTGIKNWNRGQNINDLSVPAQLEKTIPTSFSFVDHAFGGQGMTPSTCCLFTGTPGAGKSTLMQQLADSITGSGNVCLYNTAEESLYQVRRAAKRIGLQHGYIAGQDNMVKDVLAHTEELRKKNPDKQVFLIIDSLQTLDDGYYANGYTNSMTPVRCLEQIVDYAKEKFVIAIVVGQVNKSGEFAGKQQLKHMVDAHAHLWVDKDENSETFGHRLFEVQKNRFGPSGMCYALRMGQTGLRELGSLF